MSTLAVHTPTWYFNFLKSKFHYASVSNQCSHYTLWGLNADPCEVQTVYPLKLYYTVSITKVWMYSLYSCRKTIPSASVWAQSNKTAGMERSPDEFEPKI